MSRAPQRILVLSIRAIGDIVLTTPVFRLLKQCFPQAYLAVLADGISADVLRNNPHVDRLIMINRPRSRAMTWLQQFEEWKALLQEIRRDRFDTVIDLFSGPRSAALAWLSKAKDRFGEDFRAALRGFLYNRPIQVSRDGRHLVEQKLEIIQPLVGRIERQEAYLEIFITDDERQRIQPFLQNERMNKRPKVGMVPGAGSQWRIWPAERFVELGGRLVNDYDSDIFLFGSESDVRVCQKIAGMMPSKPVNLAGRTTLRELIAIMGELDLVISNVTGPLHLASALEKPKVVGLYGEADLVQYALWGSNSIIVTKGTPQKAYWRKVDYQHDFQNFLLQITVTDVYDTVKPVMDEWFQKERAQSL